MFLKISPRRLATTERMKKGTVCALLPQWEVASGVDNNNNNNNNNNSTTTLKLGSHKKVYLSSAAMPSAAKTCCSQVGVAGENQGFIPSLNEVVVKYLVSVGLGGELHKCLGVYVFFGDPGNLSARIMTSVCNLPVQL